MTYSNADLNKKNSYSLFDMKTQKLFGFANCYINNNVQEGSIFSLYFFNFGTYVLSKKIRKGIK